MIAALVAQSPHKHTRYQFSDTDLHNSHITTVRMKLHRSFSENITFHFITAEFLHLNWPSQFMTKSKMAIKDSFLNRQTWKMHLCLSRWKENSSFSQVVEKLPCIPGKNASTENTPKKKKTNPQLLESWQINPSNLPDKKNKATIQIKYSD